METRWEAVIQLLTTADHKTYGIGWVKRGCLWLKLFSYDYTSSTGITGGQVTVKDEGH